MNHPLLSYSLTTYPDEKCWYSGVDKWYIFHAVSGKGKFAIVLMSAHQAQGLQDIEIGKGRVRMWFPPVVGD